VHQLYSVVQLVPGKQVVLVLDKLPEIFKISLNFPQDDHFKGCNFAKRNQRLVNHMNTPVNGITEAE
jgi:hypothetical protein